MRGIRDLVESFNWGGNDNLNSEESTRYNWRYISGTRTLVVASRMEMESEGNVPKWIVQRMRCIERKG